MKTIWNKKGIAFALGGALIGSLVALLIPGDMTTRFFITFPALFVIMIAGIYFLDKQMKSNEGR